VNKTGSGIGSKQASATGEADPLPNLFDLADLYTLVERWMPTA
jgi:hypothetical protein